MRLRVCRKAVAAYPYTSWLRKPSACRLADTLETLALNVDPWVRAQTLSSRWWLNIKSSFSAVTCKHVLTRRYGFESQSRVFIPALGRDKLLGSGDSRLSGRFWSSTALYIVSCLLSED
jgi:hypothetical protein